MPGRIAHRMPEAVIVQMRASSFAAILAKYSDLAEMRLRINGATSSQNGTFAGESVR